MVWGDFAAARGQKRAKNAGKMDFSVLGLFWVKRPPTKLDRMLNADLVNPVWGPMCPWGPNYAVLLGGLGAISSVGDESPKNIRTPKNRKKWCFLCFHCGSNEAIFVQNRTILAPEAPFRGRAH